jgi:hypothetical protein
MVAKIVACQATGVSPANRAVVFEVKRQAKDLSVQITDSYGITLIQIRGEARKNPALVLGVEGKDDIKVAGPKSLQSIGDELTTKLNADGFWVGGELKDGVYTVTIMGDKKPKRPAMQHAQR